MTSPTSNQRIKYHASSLMLVFVALTLLLVPIVFRWYTSDPQRYEAMLAGPYVIDRLASYPFPLGLTIVAVSWAATVILAGVSKSLKSTLVVPFSRIVLIASVLLSTFYALMLFLP